MEALGVRFEVVECEPSTSSRVSSTSTTSPTSRCPKPIRPNRGDTVRVTCAYDASLRPKLRELQPLQPCYIVSGAGTSNEMCLAILNAKTKV